jgi:hypothetical protein
MSSSFLLLQVFIDANVTYVFNEMVTSSEHERTQTVQKVSFKFFTEMVEIVLPNEFALLETAVYQLKALAKMTELMCQRNIFVRSDHGLGLDHRKVIQSMMEKVNTLSLSLSLRGSTLKKQKKKKRKRSSDEIKKSNLIATPCLKLILLCLQMDHNFWKIFIHVWIPLLHQWQWSHSLKCVGVLVSSLQAFAKVRQLDAYTELFCAVSKNSPTLSISKESDDMNVSMTLACENKYQQTAQDALARCPAGQVKMLWNILERDLTRR